MRRKLLSFSLGLILASLAAWTAEKPNLSGSWRMNPAKSDPHAARFASLSWTIDQKETSIHLSEIARHADGKETKADFDCTTDGKECPFGEKGRPAKVSLWYNGPILVEMDFRGQNRETVIKKRMKLSDDGKLMQVELISLVGSDESGKLVFEKQ